MCSVQSVKSSTAGFVFFFYSLWIGGLQIISPPTVLYCDMCRDTRRWKDINNVKADQQGRWGGGQSWPGTVRNHRASCESTLTLLVDNNIWRISSDRWELCGSLCSSCRPIAVSDAELCGLRWCPIVWRHDWQPELDVGCSPKLNHSQLQTAASNMESKSKQNKEVCSRWLLVVSLKMKCKVSVSVTVSKD